MTTDRAPVEIPEEMLEAGARAMHDERRRGWGLGWDELMPSERSAYKGHARAVLSAALRVVLSDPCLTCGGSGELVEEGPIHLRNVPCPDHKPSTVWAWLRVAQDAGMLEAVSTTVIGDNPAYKIHARPLEPLFRFVAPTEEPT